MGADPTRRAMLAAAAGLPLLAVAGCKGVGALAAPPGPGEGVTALRAAIAREQLMLTRYRLIPGHVRHTLSATLEPLAAEHRAHLAQLQRRLIVPSGAPAATGSPAAGSPAATGSPAASHTAGPDPDQPAAVLAYLRAAEQHACEALLSQVLSAPASLVQLLASISASEATHAAVLDLAAKNL